MDFSFICQYCNKLYEISFESLSPEIKDLIIKIKTKDKQNLNQNKEDIRSTIFSENPPYYQMNGMDMSFVKIDRISIGEIISHLDLILEKKICDNCYKHLTKLNEVELKTLSEEISKVEKMEKFLKKEILTNSENNNDNNLKISKNEDFKSQEEATDTLNKANEVLQKELNNNIEQLKKINEEEKKILDKINDLQIDILSASKDFELEKSIQQKNQFEQITLLNSNILDSLFDIEINEKYGVINGCKMIFKNYSSFSDIFSGWGHILLLTNIINLKAKKILNILHIKDAYKFYNRGDYSYIYNSINKKKYIFYERDSSLNDDSKANELNQSMLQYLEILKDIDDKMKKVKNNVNVPELNNFIINATSINYYHIELNINLIDDCDWALCIKSLLILLKHYINVIVCKENEELKKIIEQNSDN